jgi:phosphohistidine swiveling domain-containing protein
MLVTGSPALADSTVVGHKFARQAALRRAGFPVPEFFCVPAVCTADTTRDAILAAGVPEALGARLLAAFDRLVGPDGLAAVRACVAASSDGSGEDGADDPFAGLSDSFLYVRRDELLEKVARCWASAYNPEALRYRELRGAGPARIAVGIQRMVLGERSFVAFTRDPRDGGHRCVIAAAHGIGEGVVQEKADVDHFFVANGAVRAEVAHKERQFKLGPEPVPAELADVPVLSDAEARTIAALAADVEEYFGGPQDIEGTITADGTIHLVQARPMAGVPSPAIPWTNHNVTESFPGVTCALTFSQAQEFYRGTFGDFYRRMGVPAATLRRNSHHLSRLIGSLDSHVYYRLDAWYALHDQVPGFELMRPTWEKSLGLAEDQRRPSTVARGSRLRTLLAAPGLALRLARHPGAVRRFVRWWDGFAAGQGAIEQQPAAELVDRYRRVWSEVGARWGVTVVNSFYALAAVTVVNALLRRWVGGDGENLLIGLLCGGKENRSVAALRSAVALAEQVRDDPRLRVALRRTDDQQLWAELVAGRHGMSIARALTRHLDTYGDRALHDLKLEVATPRQQPWTVLATIRPLIDTDTTVAGSRADEERVRAEAESDLRARCRNPLRRAVLRTALAALRYLVRAREDTRFCRSQLYGVTRRILWRLGELLADASRLDSASDVADLTVDEVVGVFAGTTPRIDLRALVRLRRDERERAAELPPYLTTPGDAAGFAGLPAVVPDLAADGDLLLGLASSNGMARGAARVVLDPSVAAETCQGRILVARETDPGWLFLMLGAKAMVVERGTLLSHTAITGRLLGIPTVVAVAGATSRIADGVEIEVDGTAGTVRIVGEAA